MKRFAFSEVTKSRSDSGSLPIFSDMIVSCEKVTFEIPSNMDPTRLCTNVTHLINVVISWE